MKLSCFNILLSLFFAFSIFSCKSFTVIPKPDQALKDQMTILRSSSGKYTFEFSSKGVHEVYIGESPSSIDWSSPHFKTSESKINISDLPKDKRLFFGVKNGEAQKFITSERRISVYSIPNFRDLGGIPTKDERVIQYGKLYRSGDLAELSKKEMNYLSSLGIKTVVDFRNDKEIEEDPNKYPLDHMINYVRVPIGDETGNLQEALKQQVLKNRSNPDFDSQAFVENVYKEFVDEYAHQYVPLMQLLLEEKNYPLLFHCTAGKDRTGLAGALIESAVGVDKKYIIDDFMLSNYYRNKHNNAVLRKMTLVGVRQDVAQPLLEVDEIYLQSALEQMDKNYGDIDTFLKNELGVGDAEKSALRAIILAPIGSNIAPAIAK